MKRSIVSVAALAAVGLAVAACSSSGGSSTGSGKGSGTDPGSSGSSGGSSITVGFPVPLTSGNSTAAQEMVNSAKLAVADINKQGGAGGHKLVLKVYDDQGKPDGATQVVQRALTEDNAKVIIGAYSTAEAIAVRTIAERQHVVYIGTSAVGPQVVQGAKYTFRTTITQSDYGPPLARVIKNLGKSAPAILADSGPVGTTLPPDVVAALKSQGITARPTVSYTLNSTDVSASVTKVVGQHPDSVIILGSSSADMGLLVKTMAEQGLKVPVVGFGSLTAANGLSIGGNAYYEMPGVYAAINYDPSKPAFLNFVKDYATAYGGDAAKLATTINEQAPDTYDAFMVLKAALDADKGDTGGDALEAAIHDVTYSDPVGGKSGAVVSFKGSQNGFHDSLAIVKLGAGGTLTASPTLNQ